MRVERRVGFLAIDAERESAQSLRRPVAWSSAAIGLLVALVMPFRAVPIGLLPSVYVAYAIALVAGYGLTGLLLAWWSRRSEDDRAGVLAATYLFCAIMVLANVGVIVEPVRSPQAVQASLWLWLLWHIALPLGIFVSGCRRIPAVPSGLLSAVLLAAGAAALAGLWAWIGSAHVVLMVNRTPTPAFGAGCTVAAVFAVLGAWRLWAVERSGRLDLVLMLVLVSVTSDLVLVLTSPMGFSFGTYAARAMGLVSGLIVVWMLLRWMIAAIERSDALAHYAQIAEAAPMLMFLTDEAGNCIYANARVSQLTGVPRAQALGKGFLAVIHPDDAPRRLAAEIWFTAEQNQIRIRDREGNYVWHLVRYSPLRDRLGRPMGWIGMATDLDRELRLTDELRGQYEREREMSKALRAAFLPRVLLPDAEGFGFTAVYRPIPSSNQVGGDWYDAFALPNGVVVFTMGDVSGHGLSAGASMLRMRESLRLAALTERSPARALALMNRMMLLDDDSSGTAVVAFADPADASLRVAVAGHPPPVLIRRGAAEPLPVGGLVLGAAEEAEYEDYSIRLEGGDEIAFYTDGLIEGDKRPIQGERRLLDALRDVGPDDLESVVDRILSHGQADDATAVLLSYRLAGTYGWRFRADDADSAQSARAAFRHHLLRKGADRETVARAELVFGELVGNVVRHAPGPIEVDLARYPCEWVLSVRDRGPGFVARENALPAELLAEGGRGLFLVEAFAGAPAAIVARPRGGTKVVATIADPSGEELSGDLREFVFS